MAVRAALTGLAGRRRDPLWGIEVELAPLERELLDGPALRRLAGLHHHGPAGRVYGPSASRLEHTLSVHALVAQVAPRDAELRVAALLHDVGHAPYSHALEPLGVDHHRALAAALDGALGDRLAGAGMSVARVRDLVSGAEPSPLRNRDGVLHADHLDSFVRGARWRARVRVDAPAVARGLRRVGAYLTFDREHGEALLAAIADEACWHLDPADVGPRAWLVELATTALRVGCLELADLETATDAELDALLDGCPATAAEAAVLLRGAPRFVAVEPSAAGPKPRWRCNVRAAYLPVPRVRDADDGWSHRCEAVFEPLRREHELAVALSSDLDDEKTPPGGSGGRRSPVWE